MLILGVTVKPLRMGGMRDVVCMNGMRDLALSGFFVAEGKLGSIPQSIPQAVA